VSPRGHEIGLRVALGATQVSVLRRVIGQGMKLVAVGIALGIIGAAIVGHGLTILLFGLSPTYAISIFGAAFVLASVALLACYLPARSEQIGSARCTAGGLALRLSSRARRARG
jgi:putative ABC transport system permease protein